MQLVIGNRNYSSWSMRPWVLLTQAGIPFSERLLRFDGFGPDSVFKAEIARLSPAGRVPVLVDDDGFAVWDSLAIAEYVAERFPERRLWPADAKRRARARCACAEMHSGFSALRSRLPMNIEASLPEVGARQMAESADLRADVARVLAIWDEALAESGGPMLFGDFSVADAFFAPVVTRFATYGIALPERAAAYAQRVQALPAVAAWCEAARAEHDFVDFDEPYRSAP